jgi:PqqA peptide cyclase
MAAIPQTSTTPAGTQHPLGLVAELTHRCPLHCPYCSNPTELSSPSNELSTGEWQRVLREAAGLGVLHALFSGGEPLLRGDLEELVAAARVAGLYTNLITSAVGLNRLRCQSLKEAGLDSVQISFQASEPLLADAIAGTKAHQLKLEAAKIVGELGLPLTFNVVLHRANIDQLPEIIALAEKLGAARTELANVQFYGWAFTNTASLLPTQAQLKKAEPIAMAAKERLKGKMEMLWVIPDYDEQFPKPCMNGWGRRYIAVNPAGDVLPCPTASAIKTLKFDNVRQHPLEWIWNHSEAFNKFRGTAWMPEPCKSCERREIDFGGCRCQAALLAGDPSVTDPACSLSPYRSVLTDKVNAARASGVATSPADFALEVIYREFSAIEN